MYFEAEPLEACHSPERISKRMTETHRQRGDADEAQALDIPDDVSSLATEVIDLTEAPPIVPAPPLSKSEVRTILLSLMLTMFLTALDQTIVATALPTIGRQFGDVGNLRIVGGHHHLIEAPGLQGSADRVLDDGLAQERLDVLSRDPLAAAACGDDGDVLHALSACAQSTYSWNPL